MFNTLTDKYLNKHVEVDDPTSEFNGDGGIVTAVNERSGVLLVSLNGSGIDAVFTENKLVLAE